MLTFNNMIENSRIFVNESLIMTKIYTLIVLITCCFSINSQVDSVYTSLEDALKNTSNVYILELPWSKYRDLTYLPETIGTLKNLTKFSLGGVPYIIIPITSLPESFGNLTNLRTLDLSCSNLSSLPESFKNLINLSSLHLGMTNLSSLPDFLGNFTKLTTLNLSRTNLIRLPKSFGKLTNLTELCFSYNQYTVLSESIGNLTNLTKLDLRHTPLKKGEIERIKTLLPKCKIYH